MEKMNNGRLNMADGETVIYKDVDSGCFLTEIPDEYDDGVSKYFAYDSEGNYIGEFSEARLTPEERSSLESTPVYDAFQDAVERFYDEVYSTADVYSISKELPPRMTPEEEAKTVESLCKSDTIVFHKEDPSTVMLQPIYEGRGWDVYRGTTWDGLSKDAVNELIRRHDKILFMGHGTPYGLIGGNMDEENSSLIKDKKVFALWCYAATFLKSQGLHGIFCSDNCPSEVWECEAACDAHVDEKWIFDNMVYLSDCLKDVIDICWDDPQEACRRAREAYSKAKADTPDEKKVVEFNTNTLQVS